MESSFRDLSLLDIHRALAGLGFRPVPGQASGVTFSSTKGERPLVLDVMSIAEHWLVQVRGQDAARAALSKRGRREEALSALTALCA